MVNIVLYGRLGNNLFQIATAYSLAKKLNQDYNIVIDKSRCDLYNFLEQFKTNVLRNVYDKIKSINDLDKDYFLLKEKSYFFQDLSNIPQNINILLDGYFQSYKYFDKQEMKSLFKPTDSIISEIEKKFPEIRNKKLTAINVRRGDYLSFLDTFPLCLMNYFRRCASKCNNETELFVVCSDDITWCKENFGDKFFGKPVLYIENENIYIQFYILTLCNNIIISNSTFSWWAAYLNVNNDCKVFYPKKWYYSYDSSKLSTKDLIPTDWIGINNNLTLRYYIPFIKCFYKNRILYKIKRTIKNAIRKY